METQQPPPPPADDEAEALPALVDDFHPQSLTGEVLPYLIDLPLSAPSKAVPLLLYLHGASSRGNVDSVRHNHRVRPVDIMNQVKEPCIVLSPVCPRSLVQTGGPDGRRVEWTTPAVDAALMELLDEVRQRYSIDADKIYLTGMSMGGLGAWMVGARHPDVFAAIMPMCGGGKTVYARLLHEMPMWFFHAKNDVCIGVEETDALVEALKGAGNKQIRYTRYEIGATVSEPSPFTTGRAIRTLKEWEGHNCWDEAFATQEVWQWLFQQKRR